MFFGQMPPRLIAEAIIGAALVVLLGIGLAWHAVRRLGGIPRVPRTRASYLLVTALWAGLLLALGTATAIVFLLRDFQVVEGRTRLAELRCRAIAPGHLQAELTTRRSSGPERYEMEGDSCEISVIQVSLRPGLRAFGVRELSRVDGVGPLERPRANPDWLDPQTSRGRRHAIDLLVRATRRAIVAVPVGAGERFYLVAAPNGPELERESG
jgi:hypothetical protein